MNWNSKISKRKLRIPTDRRMFAIACALERGYSAEKIYELSKITPWFIHKMKNIIETNKKLSGKKLNEIDTGDDERSQAERFFGSSDCGADRITRA